MAWQIILGSDMIIACTLICNLSQREICAQDLPVFLGAAELYAAFQATAFPYMLVWPCFFLSAQALSVFEVARAHLWRAVHNLIIDTMYIRRLHVKSSVSNSYHYLGHVIYTARYKLQCLCLHGSAVDEPKEYRHTSPHVGCQSGGCQSVRDPASDSLCVIARQILPLLLPNRSYEHVMMI